jgi:signal transduction histidine kinase
MTVSSAVLRPFEAANAFAADAARLASRNIKTTVVVSVVLICGAFAAASSLQMRFDRVHALNQAQYFESRRTQDIAAVIAKNLNRIEAQGRAFADGTLGTGTNNGLRNIAVFDAAGVPIATLTGTTDFVRLPKDMIAIARSRRLLIGGDGLATMLSNYGASVVAVAFDARQLAPQSLLENASISAGPFHLLGKASPNASIRAKTPGWPAVISTAPDDDGALAAWYGSLPLYLFVILGPALVGAGLAALFVGEFEKRARASQVIRALRATPHADARLRIRLAHAEREAIEAKRSKAEFIAHMSHELRTPLNAVIGFSEIIERGMFGAVGHAKYAEYARDIGAAGRGLHAKIGDILEFANLEAGRYPLRPAPLDLAELTSAVVEEHVGRAFSRRIALEMVPAMAAWIDVDGQAVRKILVSLIANALDYTGPNGRVRVRVTAAENAFVITVEDNGPGFKPEEAGQAGNAFARFDRKGSKTGSGLGLAIAMSLAARMGGALRLSSRPHEGTRAELWLRR